MESNHILRNRVLALIISVAVLALAVFAVRQLEIRSTGPTAEEIIEATGVADVIYYDEGEYKSDLFGATPVIAIGLIYYPPQYGTAPYYVELTDKGWNIIAGEYDWSPDKEETVWEESHIWSYAKYRYYKDNARFKPGQAERVASAILDVESYHARKTLIGFVDAVLRAVAASEYQGWRVIEIDVIALESPAVVPGYNGQKPGYVVALNPSLSATLAIFRKHKEEFFFDGKWVTIKKDIIETVANEGLTEEGWAAMVERGQAQMVPIMTFFGPRGYTKGFNRAWQGRELAAEGAT